MDNLKYYTGSLAHDFDHFLPKVKTQSKNTKKYDNIVKMPANKTGNKKSTNVSASAGLVAGKLTAALTVAFVLIMIFMQINLRAQITEAREQINRSKSALDELKSEEVRLEMQLERKISYKNLEHSAVDLGMKKKEKSQVVYIRTNQNSVAVTQDGQLTAQNESLE